MASSSSARDGRRPMKVVVCWKWVSVDREHQLDQRWAGVSAADEAALEVALRLGSGAEVSVISLGPADADETLRSAFAAGATSVLRIDASTELDSRTVAVALAEHARSADLVVCGDYSLDRGTGSVPAYLAGELGAAQALGLLEIDAGGTRQFRAVRRLDGGRREVLDVPTPAVISVEGSVATLRRASLAASLASRSMPVPSVRGPHGRLAEVEIHPYRPRARSLPAPAGDSLHRVRAILDIGGHDGHAETVSLEPALAARRIIDQLHEWGYLDDQAE